MYDRSSDLWQMLFHICSGLGPGLKRAFWGQFFSAQMRFYRQMLMAAKVILYLTSGCSYTLLFVISLACNCLYLANSCASSNPFG